MRPRQLTESPPRFPVSNVGSGKHLLAAMQSGTLQGCCSEVWPDNVDISKRKFSWEFKTESKREQIRTFWDLMGKSHSQFLETHSFSFQSTHTRGWKKKKTNKPKPPFGTLQNLGYNIQKEHLLLTVLSIMLHLSTVRTHSPLSLQGVFGGHSVTRLLFQGKNNTKRAFLQEKEQHGEAVRPQSTLLHRLCSASLSAGMQCARPAVRHGFSWHLVAARHADRAPAGSHQQQSNRLQNRDISQSQTPNCPTKRHWFITKVNRRAFNSEKLAIPKNVTTSGRKSESWHKFSLMQFKLRGSYRPKDKYSFISNTFLSTGSTKTAPLFKSLPCRER